MYGHRGGYSTTTILLLLVLGQVHWLSTFSCASIVLFCSGLCMIYWHYLQYLCAINVDVGFVVVVWIDSIPLKRANCDKDNKWFNQNPDTPEQLFSIVSVSTHEIIPVLRHGIIDFMAARAIRILRLHFTKSYTHIAHALTNEMAIILAAIQAHCIISQSVDQLCMIC